MKKSFAFLLAVLFCLSLSACTLEIKTGGAGEQTPTSAPATTSVDTSSASAGDATAKTENTQASSATATLLTRDQALAIALQKAGLQKADVRDIDAELDRERGTPVWEIDFESGTTEYSYDINAYTGEVVKQEKERD